MMKTVLIPLDGSALAERALPYALRLAQAMKARLLLLHATSDLALLTRMEAEFETIVNLEPHLDALRRQRVDADSRTEDGLPLSRVLSVVRDDHVDLIVMSTHGRSDIGRGPYGSVADQILTEVPVPVVLISTACDLRWEDDRPFRLLVPLDGSLHSETALGPARELAEAFRSELLLVRAIHEPTPESNGLSVEGSPIRIHEREDDLKNVRQYLEAIAGTQGTAFASIDIQALVGEPAQVIVDAAQDGQVDLIVMATHGRTGLARRTLGSVASSVLRCAQSPVLLVGPAEPSERPAETPARVVVSQA